MSLSLAEARALHDEVCVIDLHADTTKLMDHFDFDLGEAHARPLPGPMNMMGHVDLPRMRQGGVTAQFFSQWTFPLPEAGCAQSVANQLLALEAATRKYPEQMAWAMTEGEILACRAAGKVAALGGIEGGQALEGRLERVEEFARLGSRYLGLLHFSKNAIGAPAMGKGADGAQGLTGFGRDVVRECERTGTIVDLAHINRAGFFEALALCERPVFVSHTGVAGVHPHWRNIDDAQLRAVADNGGCVGIIFARQYLGGKRIDDVVDHILHVIKVAGADVVALGSDFDGFVVPPVGLEDIAAMPNLTAALSARGVAPETLAKILGGNVLRVLAASPPTAWQAERASQFYPTTLS
ncbi:MAG: dipeptidase [Myxococcales bacterium]|nr:dipeptidase [Myxococcales bacterium]